MEQSIKIGVEDKNKMKNNEYLSVKQFSERAGVSSQAVYKQLNNKLKKFKKVENGKTYVNIRGLSCFGDGIEVMKWQIKAT